MFLLYFSLLLCVCIFAYPSANPFSFDNKIAKSSLLYDFGAAAAEEMFSENQEKKLDSYDLAALPISNDMTAAGSVLTY